MRADSCADARTHGGGGILLAQGQASRVTLLRVLCGAREQERIGRIRASERPPSKAGECEMRRDTSHQMWLALLDTMPDGAQLAVSGTRDRMGLRIRELLAQETGLTLNPARRPPGWGGAKKHSVPVLVERGLPNYSYDDVSPDFWRACRAAFFRPALERLCEAVPPSKEALEIYSTGSMEGEPQRALLDREHTPRTLFEGRESTPREGREALDASAATARAILKWIDSYKPIASLLAADADVLGHYCYRIEDGQVVAHIKLYWQAISFVAAALAVTVEALTTVVLTHELAHAFTHLGEDTDGQTWSFSGFRDSETALKEGLAQYYTHQVCSRTDERFAEAELAFQKLLKQQPAAYQAHEPWVKQAQPEAVREAMRRIRTADRGHLEEFASHLGSLSRRNRALHSV